VRAGIASTILIDLDYPPRHTRRDLPEACDVSSLQQTGQLLSAMIFSNDSDWLIRRHAVAHGKSGVAAPG
jgi:hypothetical protein